MFNKDFYNKILNITATTDELHDFCSNIDKKEYDLDNSFDKYYDLNLILKVMKKYKAKEINDDYLSHWYNIYNWIIMASTWNFWDHHSEYEYTSIKEEFREYIINEISELLDSLSFFEEEYKEYHDFDEFEKLFRDYDSLLKSIDDLEILSFIVKDDIDEEYCYYIAINHKKKEFTIVTLLEMGEENKKDKENLKILNEINTITTSLRNKNYIEYK